MCIIIMRVMLILLILSTELSLLVPDALAEVNVEATSGSTNVLSVKGPLTLKDCIAYALQNNPDIAAEAWNISAAGARLDQAKAGRLPVVGLEGGYQRFLDDQRLIQARFNNEKGYFDDDLYKGDIVMKLPIYTSGRITNEIDSAYFLKKASQHRLSRTRDELIYNISNIFYSIIGQKHIIDSLEFSKKALDEQYKVINQLLIARKAAKVDLLRTEVRLATIEQNLVRERNTLTVLKRVLANLIGNEPAEVVGTKGDLFFDNRTFTFNELIDKALTQRPDYLALKSEFESQSKRIAITKAEYLPSVSVLGSYGFRANAVVKADDLGFIGIGISIPLFDMKTSYKISEEQSKLMAMQERLRKLYLQIRLDVDTALLDIQSSSERVKANEKAVEQAKESLRIEQQKYELAKGSLTDILDSQSALLLAETNYYRALADLQISKAKLMLSIGGSL